MKEIKKDEIKSMAKKASYVILKHKKEIVTGLNVGMLDKDKIDPIIIDHTKH